MSDVKYVIRMEVIDVHIECPSYDTTGFEVYDTLGEALKEYNRNIKYMEEDYVNSSQPDLESITIMSLYAAEVTEDCYPDPKKYAIHDMIQHTVAQHGSIKTFWIEEGGDWDDYK